MKRAFLFCLVAAVCLGCGNGTPTTRAAEPTLISPAHLVRVYRDNPKDRTFTDRLIQCHLDPRTYRLGSGRIEAHYVNDGKPGAMVFEVAVTLAENTSHLVITGTCRGPVKDGIVREPGVDYYIRVEGCTVITR